MKFIFIDSYDKARKCEIDLQNISTNDEEGFTLLQEGKTNMGTVNTRTIRKPKRYWTTSSNDEAEKKIEHYSFILVFQIGISNYSLL